MPDRKPEKHKQLSGIIKTIQNVKTEFNKKRLSKEKNQTEIKLKMKNSESQMKSSGKSFTTRLDQVEGEYQVLKIR